MSQFSPRGLVWLVFAGILCGVAGTDAVAETPSKYQLRFKFSPQQELYYVTQNDAEYMVEYSQTKQTIPHTSMNIRHIKVLTVESDGSAEVELMIDRARMTAKNEGVDSLYDSADAAHVPTEFAGVHEKIGKPATARLTALGTVIATKQDAIGDVEQIDLMFLLPEQPVAIGGTWKDNFEVSVPLDAQSKLSRLIKLQRRYELKSVENGIATIAMVTAPLSSVSDPFQESQLVQRKYSGTIKFDIEQGCLIDRQFRINEKIVGSSGPGTALTVQIIKVDRLVNAEQLPQVDLTKPLVPVKVAKLP